MFAKHKVSQSMIDAVNSVIENKTPEPQPVQQQEQQPPTQYILDEAAEKVPTTTGMKVYGSSYGNSKKAREDQTKSSVDDVKEPSKKDIEKDSKLYRKTPAISKNYLKPATQAYFSRTGEPNKKNEEVEIDEALKGDQHKIDANKNQKIDAQDFAILKAKKKMKEDMSFADKLLETVRRSDIPAYLRKAKGDAPLTPAEVKSPKKDTISAPENLAKARNEEVELDEADTIYVKHQNDSASKVKLTPDMKAAGKIYVQHPSGPQTKVKLPKVKEEAELTEEQLDEKEMTAADKSERERLVKGMKKGLSGFKARYGARAKDVMYATATKQAMKEEEELDEVTIAGLSGWEKTQKNVKDKSGAVHTPMSRAKNLAQAAFKNIQTKTKIEKK